jgi:integrase
MSVFIRPDTTDGTYSYRFNFKGDRFSGNTGKTRKREAEEFERAVLEEARRAWEARRTVNSPDATMTVGQACTRFWEDKQADLVDTDKLMQSLAWIEKHFGTGTLLVAIGDNEVARAVAARRGEHARNGVKQLEKLISRTTVNRTLTEPLRQILRRARKVWKVPVQDIEWSQHFLPEPQELVREATVEEEEAIFASLKRGYDAAVYFAFRMGARREEILNLDWQHVDRFNNRVTLDGKGSKKRTVPMPSDVRDLLWGLKDDHAVKVFTYAAAYTRRAGKHSPATVAGQRYPLTEAGLEEAFKQALKSAGVSNFRFHDTRHTAATQLLRATGNLRLVQRLLGHSKIATTLKYAHVTDADLADGMERTKLHRDEIVAKSCTESYTETAGEAASN